MTSSVDTCPRCNQPTQGESHLTRADCIRALDAAQARLRGEMARGVDSWPKYMEIFVNDEWNEAAVEFGREECAFARDSDEMRMVANAAYEVKLTYEVSRSGDARIVAVDGRRVTDEPFVRPS